MLASGRGLTKTVQSMLVPWRKAAGISMEQGPHCTDAITERNGQILSREHVEESGRSHAFPGSLLHTGKLS